MSDKCQHCGEALEHHDWEWQADRCYPQRVEALEARVAELESNLVSAHSDLLREGLERDRMREALEWIVIRCNDLSMAPAHAQQQVAKIARRALEETP